MENKYKDFTLEDLQRVVKEYWEKECPDQKTFDPFLENTKWEDEEGNRYSSWKIGDSIVTGDGGVELFMRMMDQANKDYIIKTNKNK